jgi:hypothetical protein
MRFSSVEVNVRELEIPLSEEKEAEDVRNSECCRNR